MTIRLYLDEDTVRHSLIEDLRSHGVDVLTPLECSMIQQPDETQSKVRSLKMRFRFLYSLVKVHTTTTGEQCVPR